MGLYGLHGEAVGLDKRRPGRGRRACGRWEEGVGGKGAPM